MDIKDQVREQFGKTAENYLVKDQEIKEKDLLRMIEIANLQGHENMLDVATATGRTLLAFAPRIAEGVGLDITPEMLAIAEREAGKRGADNVRWLAGDAEQLPFADQTFDVVTARVCAHHFPNIGKSMAEMARVLRTGGLLFVVDNYAPEQEEHDLFINTIEKWRDPSHVRAWKLSEWKAFFEKAGLDFAIDNKFPSPMTFRGWTAKSKTPADVVEKIEREIEASSEATRETFGLRKKDDGDWEFHLLKALLVGRKS
ncbi:MAG: class I SAM-dependent methyltransferase [Tumebacillaceae bacterium]